MDRKGLSLEAARRIVKIVGEATGSNVNVMGPGGVILASSDPKRVGSPHEGARRIMSGEVEEVAISPEMAAGMEGVRPGYNGAFVVGAERLGVIGVSGDPERVRPVQRMACLVLREELEREEAERRERAMVTGLRDEIKEIAERMHVLSLNGAVIAARAGEAGKGFKVVVSEMRKLAAEIEDKVESMARGSYGAPAAGGAAVSEER